MSLSALARERTPSVYPSEGALVAAMRKGDERAWPTLLGRYSSAIHAAALAYARMCHKSDAYESVQDAASGLYLCMVERLRDSILNYYRGECCLKTWVHRLIGDRRQIIKAFLMQTDQGRGRADTRLPRAMQQRSALDQEIYRRLVWGKEPTWIAWDLGISEAESHERSAEILELLHRRSPRVYRRIMGNRQALRPTVSLDRPSSSSGGERVFLEIEDVAPLPDAIVEQRCLEEHLPEIDRLIEQAIAEVPEEDVRIMILAFDHRWSLAEVVERAEIMNLSGINARHQVDYRITRSVRMIADHICANLPCLADADGIGTCAEEVVASLKELFREHGVQPYLAPGAGAATASPPHQSAVAAG